MKLTIDVIVFVLNIFIKIGDSVIFIFSFLAKLLKRVVERINFEITNLKRKITKEKKQLSGRFAFRKSEIPAKKRGAGAFLPEFNLGIPELKFKKISLSFTLPEFPKFHPETGFLKRRRRIKAQKQKSVTVYKKPHLIRLRVKYFFFGTLFSLVFIFFPLLFAVFVDNLPNPYELANSDIAQTTKIYDRNGILLYQIYANENRTVVPLKDIPQNLINATIAIEDKDFYHNPGFDINAIIRAAYADLRGEPIQGGSTITQQLIKSTLLTPEVSIQRKIKEIILAFWAERIYTKDQILQMYFNQVPYGGTAWGIEAASETYFGVNAKDLDLAQSAFLAGMPQAPTTYSPYGQNPNLWKQRQKQVLSGMLKLGYINKNQYIEALNEPLTFQPPQIPIYAPHFVMYVRDLLIKKYGLPMVEKGGLTVITSLDLKTQQMAQNIVTNEVNNDAVYHLTNGAALVTDPKNGQILAMVGSKDYNDPDGGNVNVTTALRQPGSSIKVVTYSAALSDGFTAATPILDSPVAYSSAGAPTYAPVNYDGKFHGLVTLRTALANSINIPAVKTLNKIGVPAMVSLAKKMGITTWGNPSQYGLAITLGAADVKMTDMATVYGTLANLGGRVDLNPILKVTDSSNNVLEDNISGKKTQVLDPGIAYIISNILSDNKARSMEFGPDSPLNIPEYTVSVKTGTSNNFRDNWTIGYTPSVLVAVWVGNNDNSPMNGLASGITGAAPIWHQIMVSLLAGKPDEKEPIPSDIIAKPCLGITEYFIKGTENSTNCAKLATPSATMTTVSH